MHSAQKQCASCPWKVGADTSQIPGYKRELHKKLTRTIAEPGRLAACDTGSICLMACHYSEPGEERPCAGWLANQLGPGNNIPLRLRVMAGKTPVPDVNGPQHPNLEATLRRPAVRRKRKAGVSK